MTAQQFQVGDRVRTRATRPPGHTRLPQYLCGRRGRVESVHGPVPLADERAHGGDRAARAPWPVLYTIAFDGSELWGEAAVLGGPLSIHADLWETYLEPDPEASR
jgi:nitrile hydratase